MMGLDDLCVEGKETLPKTDPDGLDPAPWSRCGVQGAAGHATLEKLLPKPSEAGRWKQLVLMEAKG